MKILATVLVVIALCGTAKAQTAIESKNAKLSSASIQNQNFTYEGYPISNAAAYALSHANSSGNIVVSSFSDSPSYKPYNTKLLREAILRAAKAIVEHPDKAVWTVQMRDGKIALFVGDYGNVNASVSLGAISGTDAASSDLDYVNATMTDYNEVNRSRGKPDLFIGVVPDLPITDVNEISDGWWEKIKHMLSRS